MNPRHPWSPAAAPSGVSPTNPLRGPVIGCALLTGGCVMLAVVHNVQPWSVPVPDSLCPVLLAACLALSVAADRYCAHRTGVMLRSGAEQMRRASRIVYAWLYVLFGANEIAAGWSGCPIESAAGRLNRFVVAGIAVLVLIRVARVAPAIVRRARALIRRPILAAVASSR